MSGEYTGYIIAAYAFAAVVLFGLAFQSFHAWKRISEEAEKAGLKNA